MYNIATVLLIVCLTLSILCLLFGRIYVINNYEIKVDCPRKDLHKITPETLHEIKPYSESEMHQMM